MISFFLKVLRSGKPIKKKSGEVKKVVVYGGYVCEEEMVEGVGEGICGLSSALHGMGPISHNTRKRNIGERYSFWSGGREGEPFFSDSFVLFILGLQLAA